jgi:hypothetical protein
METGSCDPNPEMVKLLFCVVVLLLVGLSLMADYKWKRWIAARKQERDSPPRDP